MNLRKMGEKEKCAVGIFVKFPEPGKVKTRLGKDIGDIEAATIYKQIMESQIRKLDIPSWNFFLIYAPSDKRDYFSRLSKNILAQQGIDLGEKLKNSFSILLEKFDKVIIIGSDIPDINEDTIKNAIAILNEKEVVIGPCVDGGYYLIGMRHPYDLFSDVEWSTSHVLKRTVSIIDKKGLSFSKLSELEDIDSIQNLKKYGKI